MDKLGNVTRQEADQTSSEKLRMKYSLTIAAASAAELMRIMSIIENTGETAVAFGVVDNSNDEATDTVALPGSVDKAGLPWDERIHSNPAKLTSKGVWRSKRGVTETLTKQVEAELRSRPAVPPMQQPQPTYAPPPVAAVPPMQQPQPTYAPPPVAAVPPMQQPPAGPIDFNSFMLRIQQLLTMTDANGAPLVDAAYLSRITQTVGAAYGKVCNSITDLAGDANMINYAVQIMASEGRW